MNKIIQVFIAVSFAVIAAPCSSQNTTGATTPHGYMIANYTIKDQTVFNKYMAAAGTLAPKYNGKVIIYNEKATILEGKPQSVIAVAEFPSMEEAERFYNSAEYTAARQFRIASTEGWVILTEGNASAAFTATQPQGYQFVNYTIKDQTIFNNYIKAASPLAPKFDGKVIIYNEKVNVLEGNPKSVIGVAEFKSNAEAERFYNSPEYTTARQFRIASTEGWALRTASLQQSNDINATDSKSEEFINGLADLMAHSTRTPILRTPDEYGMTYEEILFPVVDRVTIEGWIIPGNSDKLIICNHPMPANRYGYPGHLDPWKNFGGFEVNFLPEYKILHDAGYNIIAYDMRNHGRSGVGSGGVNGHGILEYRDVIGSLRYAKSRPDTKKMKIALYSRCLGANATIVAMKKHPEEFKEVKTMIALQPVSPKVFVETAVENNKIANGLELFDEAFHKQTGFYLKDVWPMEYAKAVTIPTLVAQVKNDFLTKPSNVQEIYENISSKDKKLFWIEGTDQRFEGYNYFGKNPKLVLEWFDKHM